jgi:transposase
VAAEHRDDWYAVAEVNGAKRGTAYGWVKSGSANPKKHGSLQRGVQKLDGRQIDNILQWLSDNPLLTLKQLKEKVQQYHNVNISINTVSRYLDGCLFTTKKAHMEPQGTNTLSNKLLRKADVERINEAKGRGKYIAYIDESNVNLFIRC